ncbi:MAG: hypothetical protein K9L82_17855 [Chromatiaceae bacterium]|nr:hypothetical protein [Chromatiaceae bacterium]MCF7997264.1 hypothetical protein [Chromatiaceae bacterium]
MPGKRVLMVEGQDDEHVVKHICGERRLGIIETIHRYGGKAPLIDGIGVRLKESDITALGILIDADTDLQSCWQAVTNRLRQAGYKEIPALPAPEGTVILAPSDSLLPRVGVWLMPDNRLPGILEDFLTFLVPPADPLFAHVERSIDQLPPGQRRFDDLKQPKAWIHTWLAWQQEPGKPLGQAISARYLDPHLPGADTFAEWLQRLFFSESTL